MTATALFNAGWTDLVSVVPPEGKLSANSKIKPESRGKAPGRYGMNGWHGYGWRDSDTSAFDAGQMDRWGANIGLKAKHFPALDIDCTDASIAEVISHVAQEYLGPAPCRIGKPPKRLMLYRTAEPFGRMRLWIKSGGVTHLVELLSDGQQFVIEGIHPSTMQPYTWDRDLTTISPADLITITRDKVDAFLSELEQQLQFLDCECEREGSGVLTEKPPVEDQYSLRAPSMQALREAVAMIPNDVPGYEEYITFGIAIKAAGTEDGHEAQQIFEEWASRWEHGHNEPGSVRFDWLKMKSPFRIGWDWIAQRARHYGYNDAAVEFEAAEPIEVEVKTHGAAGPVEYSDAAMAERIIRKHGADIKFCAALGGWMTWDGKRWAIDETMQVHYWAGKILQEAAIEVIARPDWKPGKVDKVSERLSSNAGRNAACNYAQADPRITAAADEFDADPWLLNTPGGVVNLKTGMIRDRIPGEKLIKCTAVAPSYDRQPVRFLKFLNEMTGGDRELQTFLKKLCGYCLTGSISEQQLTFLYGSGGNGKSLFVVGVLAGILGDYAKKSQMETFIASGNDRHPTELAGLRGARLVYASETQGGRRWNEARIKELTGGEPVTARFMHKDEFTFVPAFKLMFLGNHRPEMRQIDDGIKRRLNLIPCTVKPQVVDRQLDEKLREEWPGILAWMIEGCLEWQVEGLNPPAAVTLATQDYLDDEDAVGRWLRERCVQRDDATATSASLYDDWRSWCGESGEYAGSQKRLSTTLKERGFPTWREPRSGRQGFRGVELIYNPADFAVVEPQKLRA